MLLTIKYDYRDVPVERKITSRSSRRNLYTYLTTPGDFGKDNKL